MRRMSLGLVVTGLALACAAVFVVGSRAVAQGDLELRYELVPGGLPEDLQEPEPEGPEIAPAPEAAESIPEANATQAAATGDTELRVDLGRTDEQESIAVDIQEETDSTNESLGADSQTQELEPEPEAAAMQPQESPQPEIVLEPLAEPGPVPVLADPVIPEPVTPEPVAMLDPIAAAPLSQAREVDASQASAALPSDLDAGLPPLPEPLRISQAPQAAPVQMVALELPVMEWEEAYTEEEIEHFLFAALYSRDEQYAQDMGGSTADVRPKVVTRWEKDVTVRIDGQPTPEQIAMIEQTVAQLDAILASTGAVRMTLTQGQADLVVRVLDSPASGGIDGYTNKRYHHGDVIIGCDMILYGQGGLSRATVQREFLHALGFMGYDPEPRTTVLARPGEQAAQGDSLPDLDRRALAMLYSPGIRPGMDLEEVLAVLAEAWPN